MKSKNLPFLLAALFFGISLFLPAIIDDRGTTIGIEVLQIGWMATVFGSVAWWANVLGIAAFIFTASKMHKTGLVLSILAFIVALQSYGFTSYPADESGDGTRILVHYLGVGFYAWVLSFIFIFLQCFNKVRNPAVPSVTTVR